MGSYRDKASRNILIYYITAQIIVAYLYISESDVEDQNEVERARWILMERQKFAGITIKVHKCLQRDLIQCVCGSLETH